MTYIILRMNVQNKIQEKTCNDFCSASFQKCRKQVKLLSALRKEAQRKLSNVSDASKASQLTLSICICTVIFHTVLTQRFSQYQLHLCTEQYMFQCTSFHFIYSIFFLVFFSITVGLDLDLVSAPKSLGLVSVFTLWFWS